MTRGVEVKVMRTYEHRHLLGETQAAAMTTTASAMILGLRAIPGGEMDRVADGPLMRMNILPSNWRLVKLPGPPGACWSALPKIGEWWV
jgi:hypothetical protein